MLQLDLSANALYDTNVSRSSRAVAVVRGLATIDDISYSPQATLKVNKSFGLDSVYLDGAIGYNFYQQDTILNRQSITSEAGVNLAFANCQGTVSGSFGQQQSNLEYLSQNVSKDLTTTTSVGLSANCQRSVGFAPFFSANREWLTHSTQTTQNHNQYMVSGGIAYNHPVIGQVSLFGQYETARFPKRQFLDNGAIVTDGYDVAAGGIRYTNSIGSTLDVALSFSYTSVTPALAIQPGTDGTAYDAKLVWHPNWRLQIEANVSRDTRAAPQINASYERDTLANLSLTYHLSEKLSLVAAVQRTSDNLAGVALVQGTDITTEKTKGVNGSVKYDINSAMSVALTAATENRHTDVVGFNYSSTRVGLSLTAHL